jgi:hypothetical protein
MIVFGLQEVDLSTEGMVYNSASATAKVDQWSSHIETTLINSSRKSYQKVSHADSGECLY